MNKRIVIIGGGPGGYVAAIRAAQLGAEVHLVEADRLGGTCLNVGCIPTKSLLHTAQLYREVQKGGLIGLKADNVRVDWPVLQSRKQATVTRLVKGVESLLKANKVTVHKGQAALKDARTVIVSGETEKEVAADIIVLATGSEPVKLNFPGAELPGVIDSTAALSLPSVPTSLVIVGGGVVGIEFAALYSALGARVTVVELLPEILPPVDGEIAVKVRQELTRQGVTFLTGARLTEVRQGDGALTALVEAGGKVEEVTGEYVLVAVGRRPRTQGLGLEAVGVALDRGRITVDEHFVTTVPGIYAVGDCNGQIMLAHAASAQGIAAVEHALGHQAAYYPQTIPSCIYIQPEVAGVGLTEEEAKKQGIAYKTGLFPLSASGKAVIDGGMSGLVKVIAGEKYGEILGVHIFGPRATDLIGEAALAIRLEATVDELVTTIHGHPTISEALAEAALAVDGKAIHWPPGMKVR
ncbi:dihydrolipoamide dehydrogenase [Thermosinus carboxydivorans Nor1]|uniref:Dihydrolipoyl dehydrogenase n=1 Tax=Thermosinus carboxydivorans Nor1 TaxID=401526 RepID=A1HU83_9FIRM|nr:dihydrolipoyl dehydrogenase [Thermosinus carboxydivorans]EAX46425.1 dihydrolipoamide dehydrogenase [Thermosinus carboxydivorans Nor1]